MKTLYLIRHAKSDQHTGILADIDRPLNTRGYADAHKMSLASKDKLLFPDAIITSPAVRAISTALIFARNIKYNTGNVAIHPALYQPSSTNYLSTISETEDKINTLFLFAHNPMITNTANSLTDEVIEHIPTSGIVGISNDCSNWKDFISSAGKLILFDFPKK